MSNLDKLSGRVEDLIKLSNEMDLKEDDLYNPQTIKALIDVVRAQEALLNMFKDSHSFTFRETIEGKQYKQARARLDDVLGEI